MFGLRFPSESSSSSNNCETANDSESNFTLRWKESVLFETDWILFVCVFCPAWCSDVNSFTSTMPSYVRHCLPTHGLPTISPIGSSTPMRKYLYLKTPHQTCFMTQEFWTNWLKKDTRQSSRFVAFRIDINMVIISSIEINPLLWQHILATSVQTVCFFPCCDSKYRLDLENGNLVAEGWLSLDLTI